MSFYGNSYHYTAESFARIVLLNSGLGKYTTDILAGFEEVPVDKKDAIYLDAQQRDTGIGIQSGNHWIKLLYSRDPEAFQIMHNEPGEGSKILFTLNKENNPPEGAIINQDDKLDFEDVLKIPSIRYDNVGHISSVGEAKYYKLPKNPVEPLEIRMNKIDGLDTDGNEKEPDGGISLQKQLRNEMGEISDKMNAMSNENDKNSLISKLQKMEKDFQQALSNFTTTQDKVNQMYEDVYTGNATTGKTSIMQRLYNLEN